MGKVAIRGLQAAFWAAMALWLDKYPLPAMCGFIAGFDMARTMIAFLEWADERQPCP
jgi:hypothetical protein